MRKVMVLAAALGAAFFMSACTEVRDTSFGALARGVDEFCERGTSPIGIEARREVIAEINSRTEVGNWTASDCDGDGMPDIPIDANGMPTAVQVNESPREGEGGAALPPMT